MLMWTRQQQPHHPIPFLQYDQIRNVHLIADNQAFEMHLKATEREIYIPGAKQTTQSWGRKHRRRESAAADEMWPTNWNGFSEPRDNAASRGSGWDIFRCACSDILEILFLYLVLTQTQRINVKFHNQLHFKSYVHIPPPPNKRRLLLCEGPDMIWFLLTWILMRFTCSD